MFANKYFSICAEEISCVFFKLKLFDSTCPSVCKWRTKQHVDVLRRGCHRSAVGVVNLMTGSRDLSKFRVSSPKQPVNMLASDVQDPDMSGSDDEKTSLYTERRVLEYTDFGRELSRRRQSRNDVFSVATFNVLAQTLLEAHRNLYTDCRRRDLKWSVRFSRLLRDFQLLNADVLCLQEVEAEHLKDYFLKALESMGYKAIYKKRTHDKIDGCAIFYKTDKFDLVHSQTVEMFVKNIKLLDRDNIGIIAMLSPKCRPSERIVVATTHLLYTPKRSDIRLTQTQCMLAEIERMAYESNNKSYWPIIYTGDMNFTPFSPVYELVQNGRVQYDAKVPRMRSYSGSSQILLPPSVGITDSCQFADVLSKRHGNKASLVYGSGALSHGLRLQSVYGHLKNDLIEASTFQDEWHTVDYIFFSGKSGKSRLELVSRLGLPNVEEALMDIGRLPNETCGSDHLPLIATFQLRVS